MSALRAREYETVVRPYMPELRKYCLHLSDSVWDGEDLYQEVLARTFRYYACSGPIADVKPYLFRAARNLRIDQSRKRKRQRIGWTALETSWRDSSFVEVRGWVEWVYRRLPYRQLVVWLLSDYFRYAMSDIAHGIGMTMSAVRSLLHRARSKLRACVKERFGDGEPTVKERFGPEAGKLIDLWMTCIMKDNPAALLRHAASVGGTTFG
ncbi:RNA polymerase sigma factor [Paenibacillus sp. GCM10012307]|uniref:RNA polymerase sigma factor n=1 Tax=Paenibacillus roseus TaxID=2798579 RepID=A0A934J4T7_9BACL|nr:RNA polymerase sigma factor [Paenibacillus roseus]MBJ6362880.1 RNA polymerase sigma factor [Paenibacillus roseus]